MTIIDAINVIRGQRFDAERALYECKYRHLKKCSFQGEADGESALKECEGITAEDCLFDLRYPFWHNHKVKIINCEMTEKCRAPLWYTRTISINSSKIYGTKAIRECSAVHIHSSDIISDEFGWDSNGFSIRDTQIKGEYLLSRSKEIYGSNLKINGKYSFQYIYDASFDNCVFDTKDAFWHAKNVTVKNSVINGEYLGWYSENLYFENCIITGTQPFCYCKSLTLKNCQMHRCDLAFEKSTVFADITTHIDSVKNVLGGVVSAPSIGEIIRDGEQYEGEIEIKEAK